MSAFIFYDRYDQTSQICGEMFCHSSFCSVCHLVSNDFLPGCGPYKRCLHAVSLPDH